MMKRMQKQKQGGFTLIEIVMVIAILGILAAVAVPKFVDLKSEASQAATDGVAGALSSASAVNYAARTAASTKGSAITDCSLVSGLLGSMPSGYAIGAAAVAAGANVSCTLSGPNTTTATFTAIGIS